MEITHNPLGWFEIPVLDMDRAVAFYETVFGFTLQRMPIGELEMAMFPGQPEWMGSTGALVKHEMYKPSTDGIVPYFTAFSGDLATELGRVETNGGKVVMKKILITEEIGYMGIFIDSEGNRVAIHSRA